MTGFHLRIPPGGLEDGQTVRAHWFGGASRRHHTSVDYWTLWSFQYDPDTGIPLAGAQIFDMHVAGDRPAHNGINVSPVLFNTANRKMGFELVGGGVWNQPRLQYQGASIVETKPGYTSWLPGVRYDVTMNFRLHPTAGFLSAWVCGSDGSETLIANVRDVPTQYGRPDSCEPYLDLYFGFYARGAQNRDQTFGLSVWLPRRGLTLAEALADTPVKASEWGSQQRDTTVVTEIPDVQDFRLPSLLKPGPPPPAETSSWPPLGFRSPVLLVGPGTRVETWDSLPRGQAFLIDGETFVVNGERPFTERSAA